MMLLSLFLDALTHSPSWCLLKKNVWKIINVIRQNNVSITYFVINAKNYTFIALLFENNKSKGAEYCVAIWLLRHSFHHFS